MEKLSNTAESKSAPGSPSTGLQKHANRENTSITNHYQRELQTTEGSFEKVPTCLAYSCYKAGTLSDSQKG